MCQITLAHPVPLFDGTNYDNWKFPMEILLDEKELLAVAQFPRELEDESTNGPGVMA